MTKDEFFAGLMRNWTVERIYIDSRSFHELCSHPDVRRGLMPKQLEDGAWLFCGHRLYIVETNCKHFEVIYD